MLASAWRSLTLAELSDGGPAVGGAAGGGGTSRPQASANVLFDFHLQGGTAVGLAWDDLGGRVVAAVTGGAGFGDKVTFVDVAAGDGNDAAFDELSLPAGACVTEVSVRCKTEEDATFAVAACTDGALRIIDASPGAAASIVRTAYSHGVPATTAQLSPDARAIASGNVGGHVVVEPFSGSLGPTPLPSLGAGRAEEREVAVTGLRYSLLREDMLAACDAVGNLQVWDARVLKHLHKFSRAHSSAARGISFSAQNSDLLISGGDDARLVFWDVSSGTQIREVGTELAISSLSYHSDGYLLAAGTADGLALVFDLRMLVSKTSAAVPVHRLAAHQHQQHQQLPRGGSAPLRGLAFVPFAPRAGGGAARGAAVGGDWRRSAGAAARLAPAGRDPRAEEEHPGRGASLAGGMAEAAPGPPQPPLQRPSKTPPALAVPSARDREGGPADATTSAGSSVASVAAAAVASAPVTPSHGDRLRRQGGAAAGRPQAHGSTASLGAAAPPFAEGAPAGACAASAPEPASQVPAAGAGGHRRAASGGVGAQRFAIAGGTPPEEQAHASGSPWWTALDGQSPVGDPALSSGLGGRGRPSGAGFGAGAVGVGAALGTGAAGGASGAAVAEALAPLLENMREELRREVQEAQCALMEQSFRLNAELRRDVEELRAEVQQLRGELRVL